MPRTVLLPAGTHTLYAARASSPDFHKVDDKKQGNFTLHHVIPYRYPFFIGFLFEQLIRTRPSWAATYPDAAKLLGRMVKVYNKLTPHGPTSEAELGAVAATGDREPNLRVGHHFAWMGCNLFVGPSGTWRLDDPHEGAEERKPRSFPEGRWNNLHALHRFLDTYAYEFDDTAKTVSTVEIVLEEGGFVAGLLERLEGLAAFGRDAHPFTPDDWVILDSDDPLWGIAQGNLSRATDGFKKKHAKEAFQQVLAADARRSEDKKVVNLYRPVAHRNVSFAGTAAAPSWAVLWRLREDGEPLPELKYKANFEVQ
jgi:hypothetical protein